VVKILTPLSKKSTYEYEVEMTRKRLLQDKFNRTNQLRAEKIIRILHTAVLDASSKLILQNHIINNLELKIKKLEQK